MTQLLILVIDDDPGVRKVLRYSLQAEDYAVQTAADAEQGLAYIKQAPPDLILLDWMMPGLSGLDLVKRLRARSETRHIPIIMLTAKVAEDDKVKGLLEGADDYVSKPFSIRELNARIRSLIRRAKPHKLPEPIVIGAIRLDPNERKVTINGRRVTMGITEFKLLHFFAAHPNRVYSRAQILDYVWGVNKFIQERTVDVHILRLRKVLEQHGSAEMIETVRGLGYRLRESAEDG